ncbi:MAG: hypothetical protein ACYDH0_05490 [Candidatus Aminicenantales bacterium]
MAYPDIQIESGSPERQALIRREFEIFIELIKENLHSWFDVVIIPNDIDAAIRRICPDKEYRSKRGKIHVLAKTIEAEGKIFLVINPDIYTNRYDTHIRFHYLFHETFHFIHSRRKLSFVEGSALDQLYLKEISAYYEEYCAERFSSILCNRLLTQRSERSIEDQNIIYSGHHENVSSVAQGLIQIRNSIEELKNHGRGDRFLQDVKPMTESLLMSYFYLIAFRKEIPSDENEAKYRLPDFFHQTDFRDVATLFHDRFPHPLPAGEAIRAIKNIYGHFGFTLEATDSGEFYLSFSFPC